MGFIGRINLPDHEPPVRAYVHEFDILKAFDGIKGPRGGAHSHLLEVLEQSKIDSFDYVLAAICGDGKKKRIEFFGYGGIDEWPGNPEITVWFTEDGQISDGQSCGDLIIAFGKEESYRRLTPNLEHYVNHPPLMNVGESNKIYEVEVERR